MINLDIQRQKGFTLIELLLYVGVAALFLAGVSIFLTVLLQSRVKHQAISEVEEQGRRVMDVMVRAIQDAESITSPTIGTSGSSLTLDVVPSADDPTVFQLSGTTLEITEGVSSPVALTNQRVLVSDLSFENLTRSGTAGILRVQFTITHLNPESRQEFDYEQTFYGGAALR